MKLSINCFTSNSFTFALTAVLLVLMWLPVGPTITPIYFEDYGRIFQEMSTLSAEKINSLRFITSSIASVLANIFDSPFLGLQLATLINITCFWAFTLLIIWSMSVNAAIISSAALIAGIAYIKETYNLPSEGSVLTQLLNTTQLSDQTIIFGVIAICLILEKKQHSFALRLVVTAIGTFILRNAPSLYWLQGVALVLLILTGHALERYLPNQTKYSKTAVGYFCILLTVNIGYILVALRESAASYLLDALDYAILSLTTNLTVLLSLLLGIAGSQLVKRYKYLLYVSVRFSVWPPLAQAVTLYVLVGFSMAHERSFDIRVASQIDTAVLAIQRTKGAKDLEKSNLLINPILSVPAVVPQILNNALLTQKSSPPGGTDQDLIGLAENRAHHWLITDNAELPFFLKSCVMASAGPLSAYGSDCIRQTLLQQVSCDGSFDLSNLGSVGLDLFHGLSKAEDHGRWTDGNKAYFGCVVRGLAPKYLVLNMRGFTYGTLTTQRVIARVNNNAPQEFAVSSSREISINLPSINNHNIIIVELTLPDAMSPRNLGLSSDARYLAVTIKKASFVFD